MAKTKRKQKGGIGSSGRREGQRRLSSDRSEGRDLKKEIRKLKILLRDSRENERRLSKKVQKLKLKLARK